MQETKNGPQQNWSKIILFENSTKDNKEKSGKLEIENKEKTQSENQGETLFHVQGIFNKEEKDNAKDNQGLGLF